MPSLSRSLARAAAVTFALAAPWLINGCELTPLTLPQGSTTSSAGGGSAGSVTSTTASSTASTTSSAVTGSTSTSGSGGAPGTGGAGPGGGFDAGDAAACDTTVETFTPDPSPHIPVCSPVTYSTNPPTSGPHYPIWAAYKSYSTPVNRGFYVHDLEHGAVVVAYNCPNGCAADLAALADFLAARPADPTCVAPVKFRIIVTPDPLLDVRFAAAAWGAALRSSCFDLPALGAFLDAHYAKAPEDTCYDGLDVTSPDAGLPMGCG